MIRTHAHPKFAVVPARNHTRFVVFVDGKPYRQYRSQGKARAAIVKLQTKGW